MLAPRTTLPHFSVSSAMNFPNSAGEVGNTVQPRSANRALITGSARRLFTSISSALSVECSTPRSKKNGGSWDCEDATLCLSAEGNPEKARKVPVSIGVRIVCGQCKAKAGHILDYSTRGAASNPTVRSKRDGRRNLRGNQNH